MRPVTDFINGPVEYDAYGGQYFWIKQPRNEGQQMLMQHGDFMDGDKQPMAEMRGWGHIQHMFKKDGVINMTDAMEFQDQVGKFIAEAINEKVSKIDRIAELEKEVAALKRELDQRPKEWNCQ